MKSKSDILKAVVLSLFFIAAFSLYLIFLGIPLTKARNLTIEAHELIEERQYSEALEKLEEANKIQKSEERDKLIDDVREKI